MTMKATSAPAGLTERETAVLLLIAAGQTNRAIGRALTISPVTARNHVTRVFKKLGVKRRVDAALWLVHHDIF